VVDEPAFHSGIGPIPGPLIPLERFPVLIPMTTFRPRYRAAAPLKGRGRSGLGDRYWRGTEVSRGVMLEAAFRRTVGEYRRRQSQRDCLLNCAGVEIHALRAGDITGTIATALGVRCNSGLVGLLSKGFGTRVRVFGGRAAVGRAGLIHNPTKTWGPCGHQRDQHQTTDDCVQPCHSLGLENSLRG
jgi:hypothetical protein